MVVKFLRKRKINRKHKVVVKFRVVRVIKSPKPNIANGNPFFIDAMIKKCTCLPKLKPGYYVVYGKLDRLKNLQIVGSLLEI